MDEEHYTLKPLTVWQLAQIPLAFIGLVGYILAILWYFLPVYQHIEIDTALIMKQLPIIALPVVIYSAFVVARKIKKNVSYLLVVDDEFITATVAGRPPQRLARNRVKKIVKSYKGTYFVQGDQPGNILVIPGGIENSELLTQRLSETAAITDIEAAATRKMAIAKIITALLFMALPIYTSINYVQARTVSNIIFFAAIVFSLIYARQKGAFKGDWKGELATFYKQLSRRTKIIIYVLVSLIVLNYLIVKFFHLQHA
jgi:hypothetical protein